MNDTPEAAVCATLYLHNHPHTRFAFVFGLKKKYEFKWSETHRKLIREYTSPSIFAAEEQDLRSNLRNQYVVCTLMGSTNPVVCAKDGLATLIASGRSIGSPARRAALAEIVETARAAIAVIDAPPTEEETPDPNADKPVPEQVPVSSLGPNGWKDAETGFPLDETPVPVTGEITIPVRVHGRHTQAELEGGAELSSLRTIAKELGISTQQPTGGAKSRSMLVKDILAAEQKQAA